MRPASNIKINRQQLRRDARRNPIARCTICGKVSTRCNPKIHNLVKEH